MPYLIAVWFMFAGVTARGIYYDLQDEKKYVKLFEQLDHGYHVYYARIKR